MAGYIIRKVDISSADYIKMLALPGLCDAIMTNPKDQIIRQLRQKYRKRLGELSVEFARAKSEDREQILAELEFQREMTDVCDLCLD